MPPSNISEVSGTGASTIFDKIKNMVRSGGSQDEAPADADDRRNAASLVSPDGRKAHGRAKQEHGGMGFVTPSTGGVAVAPKEEEEAKKLPPRRALFAVKESATAVTPSSATKRKAEELVAKEPSAKRNLFGRYVESIKCQQNVKDMYSIVRRLTGAIGGNGYSGPIYGELTMGSMQKVIDLMVKETNFSSSSRFIDVGSGIGKPNLHVAQYPGVEFSCGVEMEQVRWSLGMTCLRAVLEAASKQRSDLSPEDALVGNTMFLHKNITEAKTFDPFTHVYMFSIGFPPTLWCTLSDMWNRSKSEYMICYNGPKNIIDCYEFDVELIAQLPTSMHGSKEGHMGYFYKRKTPVLSTGQECDEAFEESWNLVKSGLGPLKEAVDAEMAEIENSNTRTRSSRRENKLTRV